MSFKVVSPGILTLIQDLGRKGFQRVGLSSGGAMDEYAFRLGNALLRNKANAAQLEITYGMLTLEVRESTSAALCGADLGATLNGKSILPWQTYALKRGDLLAFAQPKYGLRAYLAVAGGLQCDETLGSVSTVMREHVGGLDGKGEKLKKGDVLKYQPMDDHFQNRVPRHAIPDYSLTEIPLVLGYQYQQFSRIELAHFLSSTYSVSKHFDRMGYRLEGRAIRYDGEGIISEGIAYGSVQVPNDGQPIVLLRDRQTIGGYPKIGCITVLGGALLSQKVAGDRVSFAAITVEEDEQERLLFGHKLKSV